MDQNRMDIVRRVTAAVTGEPERIAIRGARKVDARGRLPRHRGRPRGRVLDH